MENEQQTFDLLRRRRFFPIGNDINMKMAQKLQETVTLMTIDDETLPVHIFINGNGGFVPAALCIYDFLISIPNPVIGYVNGNCHSSSLIVLAGCKTKRLCTPHSSFQFHAVTTRIEVKNVMQTEEDLQALIKDARHHSQRVTDVMVQQYGIPLETYITMSEKGERLGIPIDALEAQSVGVIHEIVTVLPIKFSD